MTILCKEKDYTTTTILLTALFEPLLERLFNDSLPIFVGFKNISNFLQDIYYDP